MIELPIIAFVLICISMFSFGISLGISLVMSSR